MRKPYMLGIALAIVSLLALAACVPSPFGGLSRGQQQYGYGQGGYGGMMGPGMMGPGMMGGGGGYRPGAKPIAIDQAADAVRLYLNRYGGKLALKEIMEFAWNFYAEVEEEDTGIHAMELLIDKYTGAVGPEMGPNMMWNTKYSMMGGGMMGGGYYRGGSPDANMTVTPEQAESIAQAYLDSVMPGLAVAEADAFYGYYTLHTLKDGKLEGMLSVNGYSGAVWYHSWHGPFIDMKEYD